MGRVLVVDDDEGVRSFLADALSLDGHEVREAASGEAALGLLSRDAFHVVITDLRMPGMGGLELLKRLHAEHPELQVILLTAHGTVDRAVEAMKSGAFDFLQKPLPGPTALRSVVTRALERHRHQAQAEAARPSGLPPLFYVEPVMEATEQMLRRVARTDATVLLLGESGTGKEVAARSLHAWSRRSEGPFVAVNCATLSESLLESELFGHEKGAFTGAIQRRRGKIELAEGGTFFLDEIGELRLDLQARLLRVLQERTFERVGGGQVVTADVRWVAATNRDLRQEVQAGAFREDLYYRLAGFPIALLPYRMRGRDRLPLARALLATVAAELGRPGMQLSPAAEARIEAYGWPGNLRELRNALERAVILAPTAEIPADLLPDLQPVSSPAPALAAAAPLKTTEEAEREAIVAALAFTRGNRRLAAAHLGIAERTLYDKLKRYNLNG